MHTSSQCQNDKEEWSNTPADVTRHDVTVAEDHITTWLHLPDRLLGLDISFVEKLVHLPQGCHTNTLTTGSYPVPHASQSRPRPTLPDLLHSLADALPILHRCK